MGDEWRRKTYYRPRVLIDTTRVLDPQFDDALLCITGPQLEMIRNLTQYLKRRSTFVSEYQEGYYLAPDATDWDDVQAIVAELEETLMGCEEFTALFEDMLAQLECICGQAGNVMGFGPSLDPIIVDRLDTGGMQETDDYSPDTVLEAKRCAVAQLVYWQSYEWLTEIVQPTQEVSIDILMPVALVLVATMCGTAILGIPAGIFLALLWRLVEIWADGSLESVKNSVWANRDELTCAVWAGLSDDYGQAHKLASEVIDGITGLSPIDILVLKTMYQPWAINLAAIAEGNATAWALAHVDAGACDDCDWVWEQVYVFPPCPGDWAGGFPCYRSMWPGLNANEEGTSVEFSLPSILADVDIEIECQYTSRFGYGLTVGYAQVEYQDVALDWHIIGNNVCTTLQPAGAVNTDSYTTQDVTVPRNVLRVNIHGQPGQTETDPYPFMPILVRVRIYPYVAP